MSRPTQDQKTGRIEYETPGEMAKAPIPVRFPLDIDKLLREMSDRSEYIRAAVEARLRADGILLQPEHPGE